MWQQKDKREYTGTWSLELQISVVRVVAAHRIACPPHRDCNDINTETTLKQKKRYLQTNIGYARWVLSACATKEMMKLQAPKNIQLLVTMRIVKRSIKIYLEEVIKNQTCEDKWIFAKYVHVAADFVIAHLRLRFSELYISAYVDNFAFYAIKIARRSCVSMSCIQARPVKSK